MIILFNPQRDTDMIGEGGMSLSDFLFSPRGRINRAKYWLYVVVSIAILVVLIAVISAVWAGRIRGPGGSFDFPSGPLFAFGVVYLILLVIGVFVGIKRLHDRDKSGWWLLVFYLVPMVLSWTSAILSRDGIGAVFALGSLAISIWAFVELGCLRGTVGPNRYGEDPLAPAAA
jgi:uncharacterized membrane protein YhaH (DUF805 family)